MRFLKKFTSRKEQEVAGLPAEGVSSESKKEKAKTTVKSKAVQLETTAIFLSPITSEKSARLSSERTYVFSVKPSANKVQIASAFADLYGLQPVRVNILRMPAKTVRFGRRRGRQVAVKKAMITVPAGKSVQVYEGV